MPEVQRVDPVDEKAAADAELEVVRTVGGRSVRLSKSKDGQDGLEWGFHLEVVTIAMDEDGDPITSCVAVEAPLPVRGIATCRKLGPVEHVVVEVVAEISIGQSVGIEIEAVVEEVARRLPAPEKGKRDTRKQHAKRALQRLSEGDDAPFMVDGDCLEVL